MSKTSPNGLYHSQFLSSTFDENFMKIQTTMAELQMHENLHKNANEIFIHIFMQIFMSFYERQLKQQICYSFTPQISYIHDF